MHKTMNNQVGINITDNNTDNVFTNNIISLAKIVDNCYPDFDSQNFLSLMGVIYKQHSVDNMVQNLEVDVIRPNAYRLNTFQDVILLLTTEQQKTTSKKDILSLFLNTATKINFLLKTIKEQQRTNNMNYEFRTDGNEQCYQEIINIITNEMLEYKHNRLQNNKDENGQQLTFNIITENNIYSLSPTQGVAFLNRNPYRFFVEKILSIKANNDWEENVNTRLYGIMIHEIMYAYAVACQKKQYTEITKTLFLNIAMQKLLDYKLDGNIILQAKLDALAHIAMEIEKKAKQQSLEVLCEKNLSYIFHKVKITAKADRIEIDRVNKEIYIYDYKTGQPPEQSKEINGEKTQLAIIAILLLHQEQYKNYHIKKMQYICLSSKEKDKKTSNISTDVLPDVKNNLLNLIDYFFTEGKPNYNKFNELKTTSLIFDANEPRIKYLSRISKIQS